MSWKAPEVQLIHKFNNLQTIVFAQDLQTFPIEFQTCFMKMKQEKMTLPDKIFDSLSVLMYEHNILCIANEVCAKKYDFQTPLAPRREKYFTEAKRDDLYGMYSVLYGKESIVNVPLRYEEFYQLEVFQYMLSSSKSRTSKSAAVIAAWPSPCGILTERIPTADDVRVGIIEFFFLHKPTINEADDRRAVTSPHLLAEVKWFQDKFFLKNGIILAAAVYESTRYLASSLNVL